MELDDLAETEVAAAVAAAALLASPRTRTLLRRGAVVGLAGVLQAGDALTSAVRRLGPLVRSGDATSGDELEDLVAPGVSPRGSDAIGAVPD